jgi:hypothetical protein
MCQGAGAWPAPIPSEVSFWTAGLQWGSSGEMGITPSQATLTVPRKWIGISAVKWRVCDCAFTCL